MILRYFGHSFFTLTDEQGCVVATDPYGVFFNYPKRRIPADICTVSHHHHDHDGLSCLTGEPLVIDRPGLHRTESGIRFNGISVAHDHHQGEHRGDNLFFIIEMDGLRIAHAGDLGHVPTAAQVKEIGRLDVLLLPVGGYYTIDASEALQTMQLLRPRLTIPMHYRTEYDLDMPIVPLGAFLTVANVQPSPVPLLRLTAEDISERDSIMVMDVITA